MTNFDQLLSEVTDEIMNEPCVREYFRLKKIIDSDEELKQLDIDIRKHQRLMCENQENDEIYYKEKSLYETLKKEFDSHPILVNFEEVKAELFYLLNDCKRILS